MSASDPEPPFVNSRDVGISLAAPIDGSDCALQSVAMIRGVLLDLSGVLYVGDQPLDGAVDALEKLRSAGLPVRFVSNSTRRSKRLILERLRRLGVEAGSDELFTPAEAACDWMAAQGRSPHLLVHPDLEEDFADCRVDEPEVVVVGDAGEQFTYATLNAAFRKIVAGAPFLALAANRTFRDTDGDLSLDAGAFVHGLAYASGVQPVLLGKPAKAFFEAAAASMDCDLDETIMIGDDAEADVAGALAAGVHEAILVRTGKYQSGDEYRVDPRPSRVVGGVDEAVVALLSLD